MERINPEISDALNNFSGISEADKELVRNFLGYELQHNTGGGSSTMVQDAMQKRLDEIMNSEPQEENE